MFVCVWAYFINIDCISAIIVITCISVKFLAHISDCNTGIYISTLTPRIRQYTEYITLIYRMLCGSTWKKDIGHDSRTVFMSNAAMCETWNSFANRLTIAQKSLFRVSYSLLYFLHAILCIESTWTWQKETSISHFPIVVKYGLFQLGTVMPHKRDAVLWWRHFRQ